MTHRLAHLPRRPAIVPPSLPADNATSLARMFGLHFLQAFAFNSVLAALHVIAVPGPWDTKFVYSQAIGLSIWAIIDFGRVGLRAEPGSGWPSPTRTAILLVVGIVGGYTIGTVIGDVYAGVSTWQLWTLAPRRLAATLAGTVFAASVAIYFFHSRGRESHQRAQLAATERDATLAKLTLLQAQLEPHMLFNTLANLRVLIAVDPPRAQAMLDRLIAYLRATLSASRSQAHALGAEFERIEDFLALMSVRMGARLRTNFGLPEELRDLAVPPLLLQPLVENAVKHGLEPKVEGGRIDVRAVRDGPLLTLSVRDTGVGLRAGAFAPRDSDAAAPPTSFGLSQVRERLRVLYGDRATLTLDPAPDAEGGALVRITLPLEPAASP